MLKLAQFIQLITQKGHEHCTRNWRKKTKELLKN